MRDYTAFWEILGSSSRFGGCQLFFLGFFCYSFFFLFLSFFSFLPLSFSYLSGFLAAIDFNRSPWKGLTSGYTEEYAN